MPSEQRGPSGCFFPPYDLDTCTRAAPALYYRSSRQWSAFGPGEPVSGSAQRGGSGMPHNRGPRGGSLRSVFLGFLLATSLSFPAPYTSLFVSHRNHGPQVPASPIRRETALSHRTAVGESSIKFALLAVGREGEVSPLIFRCGGKAAFRFPFRLGWASAVQIRNSLNSDMDDDDANDDDADPKQAPAVIVE